MLKIIFILLFFLSSCSKKNPELQIKYSVNVPEKYIGKKSDLIGKGNIYENLDLEVQYTVQHRRGWEECINLFLEDKLKKETSVSLKQYWTVHSDGDNDGFNLCKKIIFEKLKVYSKEELKKYFEEKKP